MDFECSFELWLVRHGQTEDNLTRTIAGQGPSQLTPHGEQQARRLGKRLAATPFDLAFVSDLPRTKKTFDNIILEHKTLPPPVLTALLREKAAGVMQGKSVSDWDKLAKQFEADKKGAYREFKAKDAESWVDVNRRAEVLVVTHGGFIMEFHNVVNKLTEGKAPEFRNTAKNCSIHSFKVVRAEGGLRVSKLLVNDNTHLEED
ncbi:uncharacterized protein LOC127594861 [Hippocampus zosterae]|uniref:uncharacterized protein LOC127594861 n=1 Tax=Hippocampus zosterae TaxID=109293 RepID=UPI00223CF6AC|nr:uncharacterized protein LOC127594861 [Hippocampus zosterae]